MHLACACARPSASGTAMKGANGSGKGETVGQEPTASLATDRHGKPHPKQDQIGERWRGPRRSRVGRLSPPATAGLEERLSRRKAHRTRLTGRLHFFAIIPDGGTT